MDFEFLLDCTGVKKTGSALEPEYKKLDGVLGMKEDVFLNIIPGP